MDDQAALAFLGLLVFHRHQLDRSLITRLQQDGSVLVAGALQPEQGRASYIHSAISTRSPGHSYSLDVELSLTFVDRGDKSECVPVFPSCLLLQCGSTGFLILLSNSRVARSTQAVLHLFIRTLCMSHSLVARALPSSIAPFTAETAPVTVYSCSLVLGIVPTSSRWFPTPVQLSNPGHTTT